MTALKVSQHAREAAADICAVAELRPLIRSGEHDVHVYVDAFARFEAETLERAAKVADDKAAAYDAIIPMLDNVADRRAAERRALICRECAHAIREMIGRDG